MSRIVHVAAAGLTIGLASSCVAPNLQVSVAPTPTRVVPERAAANIHRYVAQHRGWRRSAYYIQRYPDEHRRAVFEVVHRDDESSAYPTAGHGKSFIVECDPHSYEVITELWEQ